MFPTEYEKEIPEYQSLWSKKKTNTSYGLLNNYFPNKKSKFGL